MKVYPENKKHDLCVISIENQFLVSFSLDPALYYATLRHNPRSDFFKSGLDKSSARLGRKKVMKFQREKITTGWDITKNVFFYLVCHRKTLLWGSCPHIPVTSICECPPPRSRVTPNVDGFCSALRSSVSTQAGDMGQEGKYIILLLGLYTL